VALIKQLIKLIPKNDNLVVLDFFAGSGTTGQAVLELNNEDGGNRQFILVTHLNYEHPEIRELLPDDGKGVRVCYERLYRVMTGKTTTGQKDFP
jgi:adenine-specific DNA-methyltransferase